MSAAHIQATIDTYLLMQATIFADLHGYTEADRMVRAKELADQILLLNATSVASPPAPAKAGKAGKK